MAVAGDHFGHVDHHRAGAKPLQLFLVEAARAERIRPRPHLAVAGVAKAVDDAADPHEPVEILCKRRVGGKTNRPPRNGILRPRLPQGLAERQQAAKSVAAERRSLGKRLVFLAAEKHHRHVQSGLADGRRRRLLVAKIASGNDDAGHALAAKQLGANLRLAAVLHAAALGLFGGRCNNGMAGPPHGVENLLAHGGRQLLVERAAMGRD